MSKLALKARARLCVRLLEGAGAERVEGDGPVHRPEQPRKRGGGEVDETQNIRRQTKTRPIGRRNAAIAVCGQFFLVKEVS